MSQSTPRALNDSEIDRLFDLALTLRFERDAERTLLMRRLPRRVVAHLPELDRPGLRLLSDLHELNALDAVEGLDRRPMAVWLEEAVHLALIWRRAERATLAELCLVVGGEPPSMPPGGPRPDPTPDTPIGSSPRDAAVLIRSGGKPLGTGFFIRPRLVVTAAHVLQSSQGVVLRSTDGVVLGRAHVVDRGDGGTDGGDWALLEFEGEHPHFIEPGRSQSGDRWVAPGFSLEAPNDDGLSLSGEVTDSGKRVQLHCLQAVEGFRVGGASGSPVVVSGRVIGILASGLANTQAGTRGGVIYATPVEAVTASDAFRRVSSGTVRRRRRGWRRIRVGLLRMIEPRLRLHTLANEIGIPTSVNAETLLDCLLRLPTIRFAVALDNAIATLAEPAPDDARALHRLMLTLLPWLADLAALRATQRTALATTECCFEVPCRQIALIETILAGLDEREVTPMHQLSAGQGPLINLSSVADAALVDPNGAALTEGLAQQLAWVEGIDDVGRTPAQLIDDVARHLSALSDSAGHGPFDDDLLHEQAEEWLLGELESGLNDFHYYLHFDRSHHAHGELWRAHATHVGRAFPSLWLVRSAEGRPHRADRRLNQHLVNIERVLKLDQPD